MTSDVMLLRQYAETRDADAFAELVRRYAGMVYGACMRVTGSAHDAEDVAQECFMQLARRADSVETSVAGWLHAAATSRSRNAIRNATRRRRHEQRTAAKEAAVVSEGPAELTWEDIAPYVDQALEELPQELRVPLVHHYLEGRSQTEIAASLEWIIRPCPVGSRSRAWSSFSSRRASS